LNDEIILIERARILRDSNAFSSLVKIHQSKIRGFLLRLCKHYDVADDLAQETFLIAFQKLESFDGSGNFSSWLFKISYNCFLQHLRKSKRNTEVMDEFIREYELLQENYDSISTVQLDLERAMSQLKPGEAAAISLCHTFGLSHGEAAEVLQSPIGTVKTNIGRGKEKLRKLLNHNNEMSVVS